MRAIPAEDSEQERGSDEEDDSKGSRSNGEGSESEDSKTEDDYKEVNDAKEAFKQKLITQAAAKKEDQDLCGHRLVKKIDEFAHQVYVEAGIEEENEAQLSLKQQKMLETGNTSLFRLDHGKTDDHGQEQKVMDKYFEEFRG